jgi:hypothetical protein
MQELFQIIPYHNSASLAAPYASWYTPLVDQGAVLQKEMAAAVKSEGIFESIYDPGIDNAAYGTLTNMVDHSRQSNFHRPKFF